MSITSASPPMSLTALLQPGDDISYRQPSSQTLSYGRIINRVGETLTVRRYDSVELDVDDLPELFIILQELVQTDEQENIPTNIIEGIIFVLTVKQISTNIYNVEGIVNCFFLRYRRVRNDEDQQYESLQDSFSTLSPSSIPCLILHSIRSIQNELKKIMNNCRFAQMMKGSSKVDYMNPISWRYLRERLVNAAGVELIARQGSRTQRIIGTNLRKQSVKGKVWIEKLVVTGDGLEVLKEIFGRYCIVGTRRRWPKAGELALSVGFGTNVNIILPENKISFEYISDFTELRIRCTYDMLIGGHPDLHPHYF